ncbi:Fusaric acid resistance protein-like-domain-containing protein [Mycena floridula]|nr:Fusaric acid resistance protein-like-domain-containing protein [Mycena floridula]
MRNSVTGSDIYLTPPRAGTIHSRSPTSSPGRAAASRLGPALLSRSVSSPLNIRGRPRASTTSAAVAPRLSEFVDSSPRQWTVFGQLMENEGQLQTPTDSPERTKSARRHRRRDSTRPPGDRATPSVRAEDPFLLFEVQSPVADAPPRNFASLEEGDAEAEDSETDLNSDSDSSASSGDETPSNRPKWFQIQRLRVEEVPLLYRNILKCAIAYFIASLFTYSPYLSGLLGDLVSYGRNDPSKPSPSTHIVATIAVYFHPAKTVGAMLKADLFFFFAIIYSAVVCLISMTMFWWLQLQPGWEWLADIVVISLIGFNMGFLAWMKVWMANPQFNVATSMIAIILFIVMIKEGGIQTLLQVSFVVFLGCTVSNVVCYLIWPQTATSNLQTNMTKTLDSFSTLLSLLTNTFLLEEGLHHPSLEKLHKAVENHQNSFTGLKLNLQEARSEWYFWMRPRNPSLPANGAPMITGNVRTIAYENAVDSLNRLAQHLNGLRGGTRLQYELTRAGAVKPKGAEHGKNKVAEGELFEDDETVMLKAAAEMFGDLVEDMGPPLKALSGACTGSLKRLREAFVLAQVQKRHKKDLIQPHEFLELVDGIERALVRFESTSNHAVLRLYRRSNIPSFTSDATPGGTDYFNLGSMGDNLITAAENEHVFLVYFFIFTLQEFARELVSLIDAMERIYTIEQERLSWLGWLQQLFLASWQGLKNVGKPRKSRRPGVKRRKTGLTRRLSSYMKPRSRPSFPKVRPHAPNTIQTPAWSNLTFIGKIKQSLWTIGTRLRERDTKYAIKTGIACALLAAPAFFDSTRPIFTAYWGDWALISFFVVMSPTIGATNNLSLHLIVCTLIGAAVAAGIYTVFPDNAIVLSIFGFFFSLPCFYFIISQPLYMSAGRVIILTYNLTCLYCYNLRDRDVSPIDVAVHRAVAVIAGVIWAAFISRFWWPAEARRELAKALSEFCLNLGWLYTRLVASNSFAPEYRDSAPVTPVTPVTPNVNERTALLATPKDTRLKNSIQEFMAMELHLQIKLIELQGLLAQTQHEPRLKGPFPVHIYRGILTSLQSMLDKLHSMRCVTTREEWYTSVRQDFILPVNKERHEMVGNIILYLSVLSSAFSLKAPLPPYLPPAEKSRQNLVDAIRKLDVVRNRDVKGSRQLLFFAYALTMKGVTVELEWLGRTLQENFGVIGQSPEEFEALFEDPDEEDRILNFAT